MTVPVQVPQIEYAEDGVSTSFPVPFRYRDPSHIKAERYGSDGAIAELGYGVDYTVSPGDTASGGTLSTASAAASGVTLVIYRETPLKSDGEYETTGAFSAESHEELLDESAIRDQDLKIDIDRAPKVPRGEVPLAMVAMSASDNGQGLGIVDGKIAPIANDVAGAEQIKADVTALKSDVTTLAGEVETKSDQVDTQFTQFTATNANLPRGFYRATPGPVFDWLGIKARCDRPGEAEVSENIPEYAKRVHSALIGAGAVYVDPVNGSDANSGTVVAPVQTLSYALRTASPSQVFLIGSTDKASPAVFRKSDFRTTDTPGNKLKIVTPLGHCVVEEDGPSADSLTWTANATYGGLSEATPTLVGSVPPHVIEYRARLRRDGEPVRLPYFADLASLNTAGFGWHWDGTKIVLRVGSVAIADAKADLKITYANAGSRCLIYGTKILFDVGVGAGSSLVFNGVYISPLYLSGRPYLYARGLEIRNCFTHGVDALGAYYAMQDCYLFANKGDNFHPFDSTVGTLAAEINCISREAGDFDTFGVTVGGTNNGSSMHGTGSVMRWGGYYEKNGGPNVVDTGTGKSWNMGVVVGEGRATSNDHQLYFTSSSVEGWVDTCHVRRGNQGEITVDTGCTAHIFNSTGAVTGGGTIDTDFVPAKAA